MVLDHVMEDLKDDGRDMKHLYEETMMCWIFCIFPCKVKAARLGDRCTGIQISSVFDLLEHLYIRLQPGKLLVQRKLIRRADGVTQGKMKQVGSKDLVVEVL